MSHTQNKRLGLGIILIFIGLIFLLDNLDLIPGRIWHYLFSWKGILIIIGSFFLATKSNKTPGIILVAIGLFFLLPDIFYIPGFHMNVWWPVILVILGLMFILRQQGYRGFGSRVSEGDIDYLDDVSIFGGGEVILTSDNFKGGKVTSIFGGSSFNFKKATLAEGINEIDLITMFGGSTFIVPENWNVRVEVTSIFGGFADKRSLAADTVIDNSRTLVIKGIIFFGGGEVKSF